MKMILIVVSLMVSAFAQAFPEVECFGAQGSRRIRVEVDRGFGGGGFRTATVVIEENGDYKTYPYHVNWRPMGGRAQYQAPGFDLRVDFWPDRVPQWGRSYRAEFLSPLLSNVGAYVSCRYNNFR